MIARLRGRISGRAGSGLIVDVNGVGYLVNATPSVQRLGDGEVTIEIHTVVREDALQLYGFATAAEREFFELLLGVSGVGPKVALAILSGSTPAELSRAIARDDVKRFQAIPGIGLKTAQRVVLELKAAVADATAAGTDLAARDALVELGWSLLDADRVLSDVDPSLPIEEQVRAALADGRVSQFLAPVLGDAEEEVERTLRPRSLADFVGQERVKEQLEIALAAAKARGEALDHLLLAGPPGLGKTSLAQIVRNELGVGIRQIAGPGLERKDIAAILTSLEPRDVLFIDEIHRISRAAEEILYPALEDFRLDIVMGQGPAARTLTLDLPPFTLVGATTRTGLLTTPLRDRFGLTFRLDLYAADELAQIVRRSARILDVELAEDAGELIAGRSRGTPRIANRILRRVRDVAEVRHEGIVTTEIAEEALALLEVDSVGLERFDRELLRCVVERFGGGPVGLSTLAVALGEEPETIEDVYEPFLLQLGFLQRTPRGRIVTDLGRAHLGRVVDGGTLF